MHNSPSDVNKCKIVNNDLTFDANGSRHQVKIMNENITAIILAGGQGSRIEGQDKGWLECAGIPLIEHTLKLIKPQVSKILISANRNLDKYRKFEYPVISDELEYFQGPLAGIHACLSHCQTDYAITCPCDSPLLVANYATLFNAVAHDIGQKLVVAKSKFGIEPMFMLVPLLLKNNLKEYLDSGERKALNWIERQDHLVVDFSDNPRGLLMFNNINTREDLNFIESLMK